MLDAMLATDVAATNTSKERIFLTFIKIRKHVRRVTSPPMGIYGAFLASCILPAQVVNPIETMN